MSILDILILLAVAAALVLAWRVSRKKGGCCGDCGRCSESCTYRRNDKQPK